MSEDNTNVVEVEESEANLPAGFKLVSMKDTKLNVKVSFPFDFKKTTADAVAAYGEDAVWSSYVAGAKLRANAVVRNLITQGKTVEEAVQVMINEWRPGISLTDPYLAMKKRVMAMSSEDRKSEIERLERLKAELEAEG